MNILHLDSSILGEASASRGLTRDIVATLRRSRPDARVVYRDLAATDAHFDGRLLAARATPAEVRSPEDRERVARADAVLAEFMAADTVVIGAPMYNFSVPSQLKTWIDLIAIAGVTFRYTDKGPEGLIGDKRILIASTSGGRHAGQPSGQAHVGFLRLVFAFLGARDIEVIGAEGLAIGPEVRDAALAEAREAISEVATA